MTQADCLALYCVYYSFAGLGLSYGCIYDPGTGVNGSCIDAQGNIVCHRRDFRSSDCPRCNRLAPWPPNGSPPQPVQGRAICGRFTVDNFQDSLFLDTTTHNLSQRFNVRVDRDAACNDKSSALCNTIGCGEFSTPEAVMGTCSAACPWPGCANDQCNADPSLQDKFTAAAFGGVHSDIADPAVGFRNWTCVNQGMKNYCSCVPDPVAMGTPNPEFFTSDGCGGVWVNKDFCTPLSCASQGYICGLQSDGCGGQLDCPACPAGQYCNSNGTACLPLG